MGSGFEEPGGTPPPRIPRSTLPPPFLWGVKKGLMKREALQLQGPIPLKPLLRKISKNFENRLKKEATLPLLRESTSLR